MNYDPQQYSQSSNSALKLYLPGEAKLATQDNTLAAINQPTRALKLLNLKLLLLSYVSTGGHASFQV